MYMDIDIYSLNTAIKINYKKKLSLFIGICMTHQVTTQPIAAEKEFQITTKMSHKTIRVSGTKNPADIIRHSEWS